MQRKQNNSGAKYENGENNRKAEWINNVEKELQGLEEGPKVRKLLDSLRTTLKKYQIGKGQDMKAYMDSGFKKITSILDRLAIEMNRCLEKINIPEWMTKGKITLIKQKGIPPTTTDL